MPFFITEACSFTADFILFCFYFAFYTLGTVLFREKEHRILFTLAIFFFYWTPALAELTR